jgi:CHASE3 domain sensor protein
MTDDNTGTDKGTLTLGDLKNFIDTRIQALVESGKDKEEGARDKAQDHTEDKLDRGSRIEEQVTRALQKLREKETKDEEQKTLSQQVAELLERTKERPPVERRKVHRFMGWGEQE